MSDSFEQLKRTVNLIAEELTCCDFDIEGLQDLGYLGNREDFEDEEEWEQAVSDAREQVTAGDWLDDALDIEVTCSLDGTYKGAEVTVAIGGPGIFVDTARCVVEGYWGGDHWSRSFRDSLGLDDYIEEIWNCR